LAVVPVAFKYLSDFHGTATAVSANITVDLFDLCLKTSPKDEDFLPLLRKLSTYRGLRVRCRTLATPSAGAPLVGLSTLLNLCLEKTYTAEWQELVSGEMTKIVPRKSTKKVGVYIRPGSASWRRGEERRNFKGNVLGKIGVG
jgi:hypothetical protein